MPLADRIDGTRRKPRVKISTVVLDFLDSDKLAVHTSVVSVLGSIRQKGSSNNSDTEISIFISWTHQLLNKFMSIF